MLTNNANEDENSNVAHAVERWYNKVPMDVCSFLSVTNIKQKLFFFTVFVLLKIHFQRGLKGKHLNSKGQLKEEMLLCC